MKTQARYITRTRSERENIVSMLNYGYSTSKYHNDLLEIYKFNLKTPHTFNISDPNGNIVSDSVASFNSRNYSTLVGQKDFNYRRLSLPGQLELALIANRFNTNNPIEFTGDISSDADIKSYIESLVINTIDNSYSVSIDRSADTITISSKPNSLLYFGSVTKSFYDIIGKSNKQYEDVTIASITPRIMDFNISPYYSKKYTEQDSQRRAPLEDYRNRDEFVKIIVRRVTAFALCDSTLKYNQGVTSSDIFTNNTFRAALRSAYTSLISAHPRPKPVPPRPVSNLEWDNVIDPKSGWNQILSDNELEIYYVDKLNGKLGAMGQIAIWLARAYIRNYINSTTTYPQVIGILECIYNDLIEILFGAVSRYEESTAYSDPSLFRNSNRVEELANNFLEFPYPSLIYNCLLKTHDFIHSGDSYTMPGMEVFGDSGWYLSPKTRTTRATAGMLSIDERNPDLTYGEHERLPGVLRPGPQFKTGSGPGNSTDFDMVYFFKEKFIAPAQLVNAKATRLAHKSINSAINKFKSSPKAKSDKVKLLNTIFTAQVSANEVHRIIQSSMITTIGYTRGCISSGTEFKRSLFDSSVYMYYQKNKVATYDAERLESIIADELSNRNIIGNFPKRVRYINHLAYEADKATNSLILGVLADAVGGVDNLNSSTRPKGIWRKIADIPFSSSTAYPAKIAKVAQVYCNNTNCPDTKLVNYMVQVSLAATTGSVNIPINPKIYGETTDSAIYTHSRVGVGRIQAWNVSQFRTLSTIGYTMSTYLYQVFFGQLNVSTEVSLYDCTGWTYKVPANVEAIPEHGNSSQVTEAIKTNLTYPGWSKLAAASSYMVLIGDLYKTLIHDPSGFWDASSKPRMFKKDLSNQAF